jgi:release factor glutamine methyltransferase
MSSDKVCEPAPLSPTIIDLIALSEGWLKKSKIENSAFDARELVARACACTRMELYLDYDRRPDESTLATLRTFLKRRGSGEPLQYILGTQPFRQADIRVDGRVLIPRSETEELVGLVIEHEKTSMSTRLSLLDAGTGSGCIAIAIALEMKDVSVHAVDTSPEALELARENAKSNRVDASIRFERCNLLDWSPDAPYDVLVSNPPYVRQDERLTLAKELGWEPDQALFGGDQDGLSFYRRFASELSRLLKSGGRFYLEIGADQGEAVYTLFQACAEDVQVVKDLAGRDRFVLGRRA